MAERGQDKNEPQRLSQRIEQHRQEVQFLVKQGGEQPQYEFKRTVALGRENLDNRLDFIKLAQAVANADIPAEGCIVIGADPKETSSIQSAMWKIWTSPMSRRFLVRISNRCRHPLKNVEI